MLPSTRVIKEKERGAPESMPVWRRFSTQASNIAELEFVLDAISLEAFKILLQRIPGLKKLSDENYDSLDDAQYDPNGIVAALEENVAHSLECLSLEAWQGLLHAKEEQLEQLKQLEQYIGSLQIFKSLKAIRLEYDVFQEPAPNHHE